MKPDLEAERASRLHGFWQFTLQRRLPTRKNDPVEQAAPRRKECKDLVPLYHPGGLRRDEVRIVAVGTIPGTALQKDGGDQFARPIASRQALQAADADVSQAGPAFR
jgi:hypothetical protein